MSLFIHPSSAQSLESALASGAQGILLAGEVGVGLCTIATTKTTPIMVVRPELLTRASTTAQIGVERIRSLYTITQGKSQYIQSVIIDDADKLTPSAQNSFLKLLEEPPKNVRFILTSHAPDALLPTVRSRLQTITILPVSHEVTSAMTKTEKLPLKRRQLEFIASGLPAEMTRLMVDEQYFRTVSARVSLARQIIETSPYKRLVLLANEKLDRTAALLLLQTIVRLLMRTPTKQAISWIHPLLESMAAIDKNGNVRLHLTRAMVY
jgi:hypothetical protein